MSIVYFLGKTVKEYRAEVKERIKQLRAAKMLTCDGCLSSLKIYGPYTRHIKETGDSLPIYMCKCPNKSCTNKRGHALIPDFILPHKHYSANEIEEVIIDRARMAVNKIETCASESTVRRWIYQVGDRITMAISYIRSIYAELSYAAGLLSTSRQTQYEELKDLLEHAPNRPLRCGNILGEANIWLGRWRRGAYV